LVQQLLEPIDHLLRFPLGKVRKAPPWGRLLLTPKTVGNFGE
jgi:hypothetical protein